MGEPIYNFLKSLNMHPDSIVPDEISDIFLKHMQSALAGDIIDLPMYRTNLTTDGVIENNSNIIVIDAGGTNFRCALASYIDGNFIISNYHDCKMPGSTEPVSWDYFISFLVDQIESFVHSSDCIGFCFSYSAIITPNCDGIVETIDKEIKIENCEGKLIGESINKELVKRGISPKHIIILNDTVAALLGTYSTVNRDLYSSFSGMICGTGFNICTSYNGMIYNIESGCFVDIPQGTIDKILDSRSDYPGEKLLEKMISGVYIGPLCRELIIQASEQNLISKATADNITKSSLFNGAHVSALASGINFNNLCCDVDLDNVRYICDAILERSAKCVCSAVIGVLKLNKSEDTKPACICCEGSLISKSEPFKKHLIHNLDKYAVSKLNLKYEIIIGKDTTLPGSAVAALLN